MDQPVGGRDLVELQQFATEGDGGADLFLEEGRVDGLVPCPP